jgi:hypothetical protein
MLDWKEILKEVEDENDAEYIQNLIQKSEVDIKELETIRTNLITKYYDLI